MPSFFCIYFMYMYHALFIQFWWHACVILHLKYVFLVHGILHTRHDEPTQTYNVHIMWGVPTNTSQTPGSSISGLQWLSEQQHLCDSVPTFYDLWPRSLPDRTQPRLSTGSWTPLCGAVSRWASFFTHNATKPCNGLLDKTVSSTGVSSPPVH